MEAMSEVAVGVEIAVDRLHTSVVAAGQVDGVAVIEVLGYLDGSETADAVAGLLAARSKVVTTVIDPRSPAATLMAPLKALKVKLTEPSTHDVAVAHGLFLDELRAGRLRYVQHDALNTAAQHALARKLAGGEALERFQPEVDTSPLTAAELALWGLLRAPRPQPQRLWAAVTGWDGRTEVITAEGARVVDTPFGPQVSYPLGPP
jgi:hypothetical protein